MPKEKKKIITTENLSTVREINDLLYQGKLTAGENITIENNVISVNTYEKVVSPMYIKSLLEYLASSEVIEDEEPTSNITAMKYVCNSDANSIMQMFESLDAEAVEKLFMGGTNPEGYLTGNYNLFADGRPLKGGDNLVELGSFAISIESDDAEVGDPRVVVLNTWGVKYSTIELILYGEQPVIS